MVGLVTQKKHGEVTFTDDDLPLEGRDHNKALYIAAEINGKKTSCMMVDDGSAINVCPSKLMSKLGITTEDLKPSELVIRAYDDSKRNVEGTFTTKVKVGPIESTVDITVLDIPITFAILLGRPWFHSLGGVPSTLHQKIKFPYEGSILTINAEPPQFVAALRAAPKGVISPMGFQVMGIFEDTTITKVSTMMKKMNYLPGLGLGRNQQGTRSSQISSFK